MPMILSNGEYTRMSKKKPGALIKQARNNLKLTQRELSAMVGVKASHIAYIENGQRNPSLALLRRLADTLGLNRKELLFLIHPDAKELTEDRTITSDSGKTNGWREFSSNRALLQRHRVTPAELKVLRQVSTLARVSNPRNFLFVLNSIRMAASGI
jgi:transcriptional regulator with XRE-family HTH domain